MSEDEARRSQHDEETGEDVEGHRHTMQQSEEQGDEAEAEDVEGHIHRRETHREQ
jgi:hypothetical protein